MGAGRPKGIHTKHNRRSIGKIYSLPNGQRRRVEVTADEAGDLNFYTRPKPPKRKLKYKSPETAAKMREVLKRICAKKGEVRNPHGRPSGGSISEALRVFGRQECTLPRFVEKNGPGFTFFQAIAMQAVQAAAVNDFRARDFVADRTEGRVPDKMIVSSKDETGLTDEQKLAILNALESKQQENDTSSAA